MAFVRHASNSSRIGLGSVFVEIDLDAEMLRLGLELGSGSKPSSASLHTLALGAARCSWRPLPVWVCIPCVGCTCGAWGVYVVHGVCVWCIGCTCGAWGVHVVHRVYVCCERGTVEHISAWGVHAVPGCTCVHERCIQRVHDQFSANLVLEPHFRMFECGLLRIKMAQG